MKRYISFLSILACVCAINGARGSECVDADCEMTDDMVLDVLEPAEYGENIWSDYNDVDAIDVPDDEYCVEIDDEFIDYNCPFDTDAECKIWAAKPAYNTAVAPRNPHLSYIKTDGILATLTFNGYITANEEMARPLLNRYLALMRASRTCCSEGIIYRLRQNGTKDKNIYNFLNDDANQYAVGARCMVMDDGEIANEYSYGVTGEMVADVRNSCICKNRQWIDSLLEPFYDMYQLAPDFEYMPFEYTYLDGFQREITVSVNDDVHMVMEMLSKCPD